MITEFDYTHNLVTNARQITNAKMVEGIPTSIEE